MTHLQNWISNNTLGTTARDYGVVGEMLETYDITDLEYVISWGEELLKDMLDLEGHEDEWEYNEIISNLHELYDLAFTCEMRELATRW